eukprot:TRINITY_DN22344_c0_g1_i1.p1 TRINITY_DN22344_c0_g1~~TRINITY_DN22344_c0_g1_i1.p1  ORF type:complete len:653 (-),score=203.13 TRINITY_DN22344_c0_g1_i1:128-2086(-)
MHKWHFAILFSLFVHSDGQATSLPMYEGVQADPCTTLTDLSGSIGCTSPRHGSSGVLYPIDSTSDYNMFVNSPPTADSIIVISSTVFTQDVVDKLVSYPQVTGILVDNDAAPAQFSPVDKYPQKRWGLHPDSTYTWNPPGDDFVTKRYTVPMFSLRDYNLNTPNSDDEIRQKAKSNRDSGFAYPQWGATLKAWMHASGDAATCLRRLQCQPLGGQSTWSSYAPVDTSKDLILLTAVSDSNAFFHDQATGANADSASVAAALTVLELMSSVVRQGFANFTRQLVVGMFTGEAFGFLGSRKFVDDIVNFRCDDQGGGGSCNSPYKASLAFQSIKLAKVSQMVHVTQIGSLSTSGAVPSVYLHREGHVNDALTQAFYDYQGNLTVLPASMATPGIPPSSTESFLRQQPLIPHAVIAGFNEQYTNKYYGSRWDNAQQLNVSHVCAVSTMLAQTIYGLLGGGNASLEFDLTANCSRVRQILICLTVGINASYCPDVATYFYDISGWDSTPNQYVSVWTRYAWNRYRINTMTQKYIHDYAFDVAQSKTAGSCESDGDCNPGDNPNVRCLRKVCTTSSTFYHDAISPAFAIVDGAWKIVNPDEPTMTESNWDATSVEVYLADNPVSEVVILIVGIAEILASLGAVWFVRRLLTKRFHSF